MAKTLACVCLVAMIACASAFTATPAMTLRSSKTAMSMSAKPASPKAQIAKALAPAIAALSTAVTPVFAEGTGEALGVDDTRLIVPIILIPVIVFIFYAGFASTQDNEDFFDTYDQRRK